MKPNEHEYKVMGLAPYAKKYEKSGPYEVFNKALRVDGLRFVRDPDMKDLFRYFEERLKFYRFDGIAGGLQDFTEELVTKWVENAVKKTGISDVVLSGGLFLNIKVNKAIAELPSVTSLYVPAGIGDESLAIGASYVLLHSLPGEVDITPLRSAYLGSVATKADIEELLDHPVIKKNYTVKKNAKPEDVARVLAKGEICAIFQGAMVNAFFASGLLQSLIRVFRPRGAPVHQLAFRGQAYRTAPVEFAFGVGLLSKTVRRNRTKWD